MRDTPEQHARPPRPRLVLERITEAESRAITGCLTRGWNGLSLRWDKSAAPTRYVNTARHVSVNVEDWGHQRRVRVYALKGEPLLPRELRWMDSCAAAAGK